jgi:dienelactone hydrolase
MAPPVDALRRELFLDLLRSTADPALPLDPQVTVGEPANGIITETYALAATPDRLATGALLRPEQSTGRLPVIIALHNTPGRSPVDFFLQEMINHPQGKLIGVAPIAPHYAQGGKEQYVQAIIDAYATPGRSYPFLMDTVWDTMRLIDHLVTRPDVDPSRIGVVGFSKGGMEIMLLAAADTRIAVAAPIIGVCSFQWAIENDQWQARAAALEGAPEGAAALEGIDTLTADFMKKFYGRVSFGLLELFDGPDMLPLIAPRPLRIMNGLQDPRNPMPGVMLAYEAARAAYESMGAGDKLSLITEDVGHVQDPFLDNARDWLLQWLAQPAPQ